MLRSLMRKMFVGITLTVIAACHPKNSGPTATPGGDSRGPGCAAIRQPLQVAYSAVPAGHAGQPNAEVVADNVAMMMRECDLAPAHVIACVNAHPVAAEITQLCTAPIDDNGSEGNAIFGGAP